MYYNRLQKSQSAASVRKRPDASASEDVDESRVQYWSKNRDFAVTSPEKGPRNFDEWFEAQKTARLAQEGGPQEQRRAQKQKQKPKPKPKPRRQRQTQKQKLNVDEKADEAIRRAYAERSALKLQEKAGPSAEPLVPSIQPVIHSARSSRSSIASSRSLPSSRGSIASSARGPGSARVAPKANAKAKARRVVKKAHLVPPHQRAVMLAPTGFDDTGKMRHRYMPDPKDCSSDWPIPGMQGKKIPLAVRPYGVDDFSPEDLNDLAKDILHNSDTDAETIARRRSALAKELDNLPDHQLRVMNSFPNYPWNNYPYKPDRTTGLSKWPVPGMQGAYTPLRTVPFAEGGAGRHWERTQDAWFDPTRHCKDGRMPEKTQSMAQFCATDVRSFTETHLADTLRF